MNRQQNDDHHKHGGLRCLRVILSDSVRSPVDFPVRTLVTAGHSIVEASDDNPNAAYSYSGFPSPGDSIELLGAWLGYRCREDLHPQEYREVDLLDGQGWRTMTAVEVIRELASPTAIRRQIERRGGFLTQEDRRMLLVCRPDSDGWRVLVRFDRKRRLTSLGEVADVIRQEKRVGDRLRDVSIPTAKHGGTDWAAIGYEASR